jgi:hypothetical protein
MADQKIGEEVKLIVEVPHPFRYRTSVHTRTVRWSNGNAPLAKKAFPISDHVVEADRLVVYEHPDYLELARAAAKPYCFHALGTTSAKHYKTILKMCKEDGAHAYCDTHELAVKGFEFLGSPIFQESYPPLVAHEGFRVAHAPTNRGMKGTQLVIDACQELGLELDLIENVSYSACVYRKALADVLVDQVGNGEDWIRRLNGYGVNGLEAMAMGQPVIGWASSAVREEQGRLGSLPYLFTNGDLKHAILLMQDPVRREALSDWASSYLAQHHDPEVQAERVKLEC